MFGKPRSNSIIRLLCLLSVLMCLAISSPARSEDSSDNVDINMHAEYSEQWGLAISSEAPELAAVDIEGKERTRGELAGKKGLLIFFTRTTDW